MQIFQTRVLIIWMLKVLANLQGSWFDGANVRGASTVGAKLTSPTFTPFRGAAHGP